MQAITLADAHIILNFVQFQEINNFNKYKQIASGAWDFVKYKIKI